MLITDHLKDRSAHDSDRPIPRTADPRVLIADDHPLFRHGLREFLNLAPNIEVVGEATSGEEAITQAEALHPDVILMDVNMPGVKGIEATRRILHDSPHIRILVVTMF